MSTTFYSPKLVDDYGDMIYRIALGILENREDAEDIVQEVFVKYLKKNKKFDNSEYEKYWLIRVTINLCYNELKSSRQKCNIPLTDDICKYVEYSDVDTVLDNVKYLKDKYRVVFELFYFDEYKISEISEMLNINEATVKTRLKRARDKLKKILKLGGKLDGEF